MLLTSVGAACCVIVMFWASSAAWAQQAAGSITGTVMDPSGSAVANATVTVRDVDRGTTWTAKTTSSGLYDFPQIPVGVVQLKVEADGFSTESRNAFTLVLNQVARIDFHLKVGKVNETITVDDAPPLLQTASTELGTIIDANAAASLPLATRDLNQLTLLAPGVISPNIFAFQSPQTTFGTGRPYVNGAREQDNNFSLDGMDVNQPDNNDVAYTPSPDAVQEFNMIVSNAPADYGSYAGGVIVETLKSGTNQFHGNLFEFVRNDFFNANTWQDKANAFLVAPDPNSGNLVASGKALPRALVRWNEFGGTIGGPIIKNKLFFFADEETSLYDQPRTANNNNTYTNAYLGGDLGVLCTSQGAHFINSICSNTAYQLYDPDSPTRAPFVNNVVPVRSQIAAKIVGSPQFASQFTNPVYYTSNTTSDYQGDAKIDWEATQRDHVMGRYTQMYTIVKNSNGTNLLSPNLTREYPLKNIVADYVRTITPTLVNDARIGAQIFPANDQEYTNPAGAAPAGGWGIPGVEVPILPAMTIGIGTIGNADGVEIFHDTTYEAEDSLTWTHGKQSIHAGFEIYHYTMNDTYAGNQGAAGQFIFNGQFTGSNGNIGNAYADFLLGLPQEVQVGVPLKFHLTNSLYAGFVQDTFQVTHNLTLNLGLRYELVTPRGDKTSSNNVNFDKITGTPEIGSNYKTYKGPDNFQPRFGFAWQPGWAPNSVLRGAYTISTYMEGNGVSNMAIVNPPNAVMVDNKASATALLPDTTLDQGYTPFSAACTAAQLLALSPQCVTGKVTHATDQNLQPAVNQQWNLTVQHQFKTNLTASLGYVGNKDDHMSDIYLFNQKELNSAGVAVQGPYMQNLLNAGVGQARYNASDGISRYEALEATLSQKNYHGLDLQANFTWSKSLTNSLGYFGSYGDEEGAGESQTQATQNFFQNEYDPKADYGRSSIDTAAAFNVYGLYNLPFGRGKQFANHVNKGVDEIIGGWNVSADATLRSGFAITPFAGAYMGDEKPDKLTASQLTGSYMPLPNCVPGKSGSQSMQFVQIGGSIGMVNLNPAALTNADDGAFGNCQTGALRGPSLKTSDLNLNKTFPIAGRVNMTFMAQFMNLTNTPIFSVPASWWGQYSSCVACNGVRTTGYYGGGAGTVGSFGLLDGSNPGRQIEFSLKLNY
jgi:hypothetical protein